MNIQKKRLVGFCFFFCNSGSRLPKIKYENVKMFHLEHKKANTFFCMVMKNNATKFRFLKIVFYHGAKV